MNLGVPATCEGGGSSESNEPPLDPPLGNRNTTWRLRPSWTAKNWCCSFIFAPIFTKFGRNAATWDLQSASWLWHAKNSWAYFHFVQAKWKGSTISHLISFAKLRISQTLLTRRIFTDMGLLAGPYLYEALICKNHTLSVITISITIVTR